MTDSALAAQTQRIVDAYYRGLPDTVTIADAMIMSWCPQRNLVLRKALGIPLESEEVCQVTKANVVELVAGNKKRADRYAAALAETLEDWAITSSRRADGRHVVFATPPL